MQIQMKSAVVMGMALLVAGAPAATAQVIPVANPSFELDPADPGCFAIDFVPVGWSLYDPHGIAAMGNFFGVLNPGPTTYFLPGQVPDGEQVALLFFTGSIGQGELGISQLLGVDLQADRLYRLTVGVGNIASGASPVPPCSNGDFFDLDGFPGYAVQLLAGGTVIAQDNNALLGSIPEAEFRTSVVEVEIASGHPQLGGELEIRLINLNENDPTVASPGIEVDFDAVQLEAIVIACPGDIADDFGTIGADGMVSFGDFLAMLGLIGPCPGMTPGCTGDIADDFGTLNGGDGMVSFGDFLALLGLIGPCP